MLLGNQRPAKAGFTVPEVLVAAALVAVFFCSIFEVNGLCLRFISASKENVGATEAVHDRLEQLRNADFTTLTTVSSIKSLLAQSANPSPLAKKAIETVRVDVANQWPATFGNRTGAAQTSTVIAQGVKK